VDDHVPATGVNRGGPGHWATRQWVECVWRGVFAATRVVLEGWSAALGGILVAGHGVDVRDEESGDGGWWVVMVVVC
jgi:hypothetical protein